MSHDCRLKEAIGIAETCPRERCGLWERLEGGFVRGSCSIERLGLEQAVRDRQLASWLLDLRERLEGATAAGTQPA
jgi:hypothetical protein